MHSPWVIVFGPLLIVQILPSHALPITESDLVSVEPLMKAINASVPESASSSLLNPQLMDKGRPPIDAEDSENPSLLTSIPTFAPPAAIKGRGDNRGDVGVNIPIPTVSIGIPHVRVIRSQISDALRRLLRRSPFAQSAQPLPPAPTDAIQPHRASITDSTVNFVKDTEQHKNSDPTDQLNEKTGLNETDSDTTTNDIAEDTYGESADALSNVIQDMASPGTPLGTPSQSEVGSTNPSGNSKSHSLSHSLGTISHAQFEEEDSGKKRRKRSGHKREVRTRKRAPNPDDGRSLGEKPEDFEVPTIWNGKVDLDDLNWGELQELDDWLDTLAFMQKHKKAPSRNLSSIASPTVTSNSSAPPPKSLAKTFGLKPHSSLQNKTHRGNRRDETWSHSVSRGIARELLEPGPNNLPQKSSAQGENLKAKREDDYDPKLEPVDISDEAFDEFRKKNPTFFGGLGGKERRAISVSSAGYDIQEREPVTPSWFAMLLSPSALLEKRPAKNSS